jgi:hypothetical protein
MLKIESTGSIWSWVGWIVLIIGSTLLFPSPLVSVGIIVGCLGWMGFRYFRHGEVPIRVSRLN